MFICIYFLKMPKECGCTGLLTCSYGLSAQKCNCNQKCSECGNLLLAICYTIQVVTQKTKSLQGCIAALLGNPHFMGIIGSIKPIIDKLNVDGTDENVDAIKFAFMTIIIAMSDCSATARCTVRVLASENNAPETPSASIEQRQRMANIFCEMFPHGENPSTKLFFMALSMHRMNPSNER